jgi:uncharacterized protein YciI
MLFAIICADKPGRIELRQSTRPAHLAHLQAHQAQLVEAGPLLDAEGKPCGSLLLVDMADRAAAEVFATADPYAKAGLFESVLIRPYRAVFKDGKSVT